MGERIMEKVIIFGAGVQGRKILNEVREKYEVVLLIDNDPKKNDTYIEGIRILNLSKQVLDEIDYDAIIIGTLSGYKAIMRQLMDMGVPSMKINTSWVELPTLAREKFVETLGVFLGDKGITGNVAEGGVFQGEFSAVMNKVFADRKLYLFDTFEGFDERDIDKEHNFSSAKQGDYAITSENMVMQKMAYPENVIIKKGYFPDSANGIDDKFCFVNLDFDLYNPTSSGLEWFERKMVSGGVILVHDYFSTQFRGVKEAVDDYIRTREHLKLIPIGDTISIAIVGF